MIERNEGCDYIHVVDAKQNGVGCVVQITTGLREKETLRMREHVATMLDKKLNVQKYIQSTWFG
jgi:hypothetical protein